MLNEVNRYRFSFLGVCLPGVAVFHIRVVAVQSLEHWGILMMLNFVLTPEYIFLK